MLQEARRRRRLEENVSRRDFMSLKELWGEFVWKKKNKSLFTVYISQSNQVFCCWIFSFFMQSFLLWDISSFSLTPQFPVFFIPPSFLFIILLYILYFYFYSLSSSVFFLSVLHTTVLLPHFPTTFLFHFISLSFFPTPTNYPAPPSFLFLLFFFPIPWIYHLVPPCSKTNLTPHGSFDGGWDYLHVNGGWRKENLREGRFQFSMKEDEMISFLPDFCGICLMFLSCISYEIRPTASGMI